MFPSSISGDQTGLALFTPAYTTFTTSAGVLVTALSVSGTGILSGVNVTTVSGAATLRITIDGNVVINDTAFASGTNATVGLTTNWYFKRSLLIEAISAGANAETVRIAYMVA